MCISAKKHVAVKDTHEVLIVQMKFVGKEFFPGYQLWQIVNSKNTDSSHRVFTVTVIFQRIKFGKLVQLLI